jgi:hypothetical protein
VIHENQFVFRLSSFVTDPLFVHEPFDAPLWRFLKLRFRDLEGAYAHVFRNAVIEVVEVTFVDFGQMFACHTGLFHGILVGNDQSNELFIALDHQGFHHHEAVVEDRFELFRVDVLPGGAEDHALRAALDVDVALLIDHP